ncbi:MAG TPA: magnesium/cobalt transporter CorA [Methanoregulaceae archaeon]|nr:magnesium/cobalt transporter CorA [Methanoregulaceae archaeon]HPD75843.1 magnesium/cobalt transporter CorA [Methanoregulaceae archaeon]HRY75699.1 magnesium/cobalt transporter CorA [Methanoregulaceae archaeon]
MSSHSRVRSPRNGREGVAGEKDRRRPGRKAGLPPGTLIPPPGSREGLPPVITILDYDANTFQEKTATTLDECRPFRDTGTVTWINIDGLSDVTLIGQIGKCFGIHPLILESILNTAQRPRMEDLESYIYVNLKMLQYLETGRKVKIEQVGLIIGTNFVISFQEDVGDVFDPVRERIRKDGRIRKFGTDYLAYALIDAIVDNYFIVMESLGEQVELLEEALATNPSREMLLSIHTLKKEMIYLRKSVWPLREVISGLERSDNSLIRDSTRIYLRDVYDHTIQVIDTIETFRDMVSGMIDIYLSGMSMHLNEVMKVLTLIATIFIPLTFIVGIYGMNFDYMPELSHPYGYYGVWAVMILVIATMLIYFRKRQWI